MFVDLSMPVNEDTVVFPGDATPKFEPTGGFAEYDVVDTVVHVNVHLGTHIDAPVHMVKGGKFLHQYSVERFFCSGVCVDARGVARLNAKLLDGIDLEAGMAVLFYTGTGDRYKEQSYATEYPPIDEDLAVRLIEKGVSMVGIDMISFDHDVPFPIHKELLSKDILLIENLINLDKVVGKRFKLAALPAHLELEAAPTRVIAEV